MAKYTTEIISLVRSFSSDTLSMNDRIDEAAKIIFDFHYPIWEETYRDTLNRKILRHYLRREISEETYFAWKTSLETRMFEIMPYYNQMYLTTLESFDGINDIDITTVFIKGRDTSGFMSVSEDTNMSSDEISSGTNNTQGERTDKDYPQATVTATDALFYASQGSTNDMTANAASDIQNIGQSSRNISNTNNQNVNEDSTERRKGRSGARDQGTVINDFRNAIINIDLMVITNLHDLFMLIW